MGKRELLLIVAFLVVGVVVYHATAPPPAPGEESFSVGKVMEAVRRHVRGNRASAERSQTDREDIGPQLTELRLVDRFAEVEVVGEDRANVEIAFRVRSTGYDDNEAAKLANETVLKRDRAGSTLELRVTYPDPGSQWAYLKLRVPARLQIRTENIGKATIEGVASVELSGSRGEATIRNIAGRAVVNHRGGPLVLEDLGALKLTGRGAEVTVKKIRGDTSITLEQGGELTAAGLAGAIDIESRNADVKIPDLTTARGPIRVNTNGGSAELGGVKADTRIDGRHSEIDVTMAAAVPLTIYNDGASIKLTPPPGGFTLDAVSIEGRLEPQSALESLGLKTENAEGAKESRASGAVNGGGPTITIRATRGDVTIRERTPAAR